MGWKDNTVGGTLALHAASLDSIPVNMDCSKDQPGVILGYTVRNKNWVLPGIIQKHTWMNKQIYFIFTKFALEGSCISRVRRQLISEIWINAKHKMKCYVPSDLKSILFLCIEFTFSKINISTFSASQISEIMGWHLISIKTKGLLYCLFSFWSSHAHLLNY